MWLLISRRIRLWLVLAVGAPLLGWLLGLIGDRLEARNGPSSLTRLLQKARGRLRRRRGAPASSTATTRP